MTRVKNRSESERIIKRKADNNYEQIAAENSIGRSHRLTLGQAMVKSCLEHLKI